MTQLRTRRPPSPRRAGAVRWPVDTLLDAALFKALSDPTRLRLLACMIKCGRPCGVGEIAGCCAVDLSVVSRHLRLLERAGAIASVKRGREVSYAVHYQALSARFAALAVEIGRCCPNPDGGDCCTGDCND